MDPQHLAELQLARDFNFPSSPSQLETGGSCCSTLGQPTVFFTFVARTALLSLYFPPSPE